MSCEASLWCQYPPTDFFSENHWPLETRDERELDFQLYPQQMVPISKLRERAEQLRGSSRQGFATPIFTAPPQSNINLGRP
jgi:hypothetical protein